KKVSLQTKTLRYNKMFWVEALELTRHWDDSRIDAEITGPQTLTITSKNIERFALSKDIRAGSPTANRQVAIDGQPVESIGPIFKRGPNARWEWTAASENGAGLKKRPGLQGPIDDAFM